MSEADYSVDHDATFFEGEVITSPTLTPAPIRIQLLPLTFAQYNDMFPDGPCSIPEDTKPAQSEWSSSLTPSSLSYRESFIFCPGRDFNQTVIEIEIPANPQSNNLEVSFQVPLLQTNAVEAEETFLLLLHSVNSEEATIGAQACSTVQIAASRPPPDGK